MGTKSAEKSPVTLILGTAALALAILLGILILLCLPYLGKNPAAQSVPTAPPTEAPTQPPTEAPTEPPTQPPAEPNPYGKLDFQYEGRYLKCQVADSVTGIDVSAHQKTIDWAKVRASGVEFAMIRLGYRGYESGEIVEDAYARENLKGAVEAGLDVGVYFFSQAVNMEEALEEARFVLDFIAEYDITMPVVYDWETIHQESARTRDMDARTLTDCSLAFLGAVEDAGYWPMLYFNAYQSRHMLYLAELNRYDFWLARYSDRMTYPYKIKMWQYTNSGRVPGIEGNADINVFFPDT